MQKRGERVTHNKLISPTPQVLTKNQDSSVGTATGYGLGDQMIGVRFPAGDGNFSPQHRVHTSLGSTHPPI
jgi:hypothetical protein